MRSNLRMLTLIALHPGGILDRRALSRQLYPDEVSGVAANRLRVALNRLRQLLGDALIEDSRGLRLAPEAWTFDWAELQIAISHAQDHVDESLERSEWSKLIPALLASWGADTDCGWLDQAHKEWEHTTSAALRRAAELLVPTEAEVASRCAEAALVRHPGVATTWDIWLRAEHAQGRGAPAIQRLKRAERDHPLLGSEVHQTVERIRSGPVLAEESPLAGSLLEVLLTTRLDLARALLSAPQTMSLSGANPAAMVKLLERVLDPPDPGDEAWERCMARAIGLWSWLNDVERVFEHSPKLIESSQKPIILRAVWSALSAAYANRGDWVRAHETIDASLEIAARLEDPIEYLTGLGNKATYLWREGRFAEGREMHDRSIAGLTAIDSPRARFEVTLALANRSFIAAFEGDWERAKLEIEAAIADRAQHFPDLSPNLLLPCLVMVRAKLGDRVGLARNLHTALKQVFSTGSARFEQNALEFAAVAVSTLPQGGSVARVAIDAVAEYRTRTGYPRAFCEEQLLAGIPLSPSKSASPSSMTAGEIARELVRFAKLYEQPGK